MSRKDNAISITAGSTSPWYFGELVDADTDEQILDLLDATEIRFVLRPDTVGSEAIVARTHPGDGIVVTSSSITITPTSEEVAAMSVGTYAAQFRIVYAGEVHDSEVLSFEVEGGTL